MDDIGTLTSGEAFRRITALRDKHRLAARYTPAGVSFSHPEAGALLLSHYDHHQDLRTLLDWLRAARLEGTDPNAPSTP